MASIIAVSSMLLTSCVNSSKGDDGVTGSVVEKHIMDTEVGKEITCPVMKKDFEVTSSTPVVEYKGKRYHFCCLGCEYKFMEDPEKYIGEDSK
jgi:YHS domain-containing protein